jgi:hypothetical protein
VLSLSGADLDEATIINEDEIIELKHGGFLPSINAPLSSKLFHGIFVQCRDLVVNRHIFIVLGGKLAKVMYSNLLKPEEMAIFNPYRLEDYEYYLMKQLPPLHCVKFHPPTQLFTLRNGQLLRPGNSPYTYYVDDYYLHKGI